MVAMRDISGTAFTSTDVQAVSTLLDGNSVAVASHVVTLEGTAYAFVAVGMGNTDAAEIDMVVRTSAGDAFEPLRAANGQVLTLSRNRNIIPIPIEGRYRVRVTGGSPGDFVVVAYPNKVSDELWKSIIDVQDITIKNEDGSLVVAKSITSSGPQFDVEMSPTGAADVITASAGAMAILANAIGNDPTLATIVADLVANPTNLNLLTDRVVADLVNDAVDMTQLNNALKADPYLAAYVAALASSVTNLTTLAAGFRNTQSLSTDDVHNTSVAPGVSLTDAINNMFVSYARIGV